MCSCTSFSAHTGNCQSSTTTIEERSQEYSATVGFNKFLSVDRPTAPVSTFDQHIRPNFANDFFGANVVEHNHIVDHFEGCKNASSFSSPIAVDPDNQNVALRSREAQKLKMADMQQVEAPVGKNDLLTCSTPGLKLNLQFADRDYLLLNPVVSGGQSASQIVARNDLRAQPTNFDPSGDIGKCRG